MSHRQSLLLYNEYSIYIQGLSRVYRGCIEGVSRIYLGCIEGVSMVYLGYIQGVSRVYRGCIDNLQYRVYVCNVDSLYDNIDVISMKCTRHTYNLYIYVSVYLYILYLNIELQKTLHGYISQLQLILLMNQFIIQVLINLLLT